MLIEVLIIGVLLYVILEYNGSISTNKFLNDNLKTNDKNLKYLAIKQNNSNLVTGYHIGHLDLDIINPYILHKQGYQKQIDKNRDGDFDPKANMHLNNGIWSGEDLKFEKLNSINIYLLLHIDKAFYSK